MWIFSEEHRGSFVGAMGDTPEGDTLKMHGDESNKDAEKDQNNNWKGSESREESSDVLPEIKFSLERQRTRKNNKNFSVSVLG